jgi:cytochrome b561
MTVARERTRHNILTRVLHWLTAALVFTMLMIGFVMVNSLEDYASLVMIHKSLGVVILAVVLVRIANRLTHRAPALPSTVGSIERCLVVASELSLYALLVAQPLVGWAMVSASGRPVVVFGFRRSHHLMRNCFRCSARRIRSAQWRWWSRPPRMYRRCCCIPWRCATACCRG